jgi:hypothetical protein
MSDMQLQKSVEKVSTSETSAIERVYDEMNLNDYLVSVSFLLLLIFACIGTYSWLQSVSRLPSSSAIADANPLTHMMEGSTSAAKLKRKVKKKRHNLATGPGSGPGTGNTDVTGSAAGTIISVSEATPTPKLVHANTNANNENAAAGIAQRKGKTSNGGKDKERVSVALPQGLSSNLIHNPQLLGAPVTNVHYDEGNDDSSSGSGSGSGSAIRSAASSVSTGVFEENLTASLHLLLRDGINITWHRGASKAAKTVRLGLSPQGDVLQWTGVRMLARHKYELSLRDVSSIEYGKNTDVFHRSELARLLPNDVCFSFVMASVPATANGSSFSGSSSPPLGGAGARAGAAWATVDFQAASKMERDLLVHGFTLIISELRRRGRDFDHEL